MTLQYILDKLEQEPELDKRIDMAADLVPKFQDHFPKGNTNPPLTLGFYSSNDESFRRILEAEEAAFNQIKAYTKGQLPSCFWHASNLFDANKRHAIELLKTKKEDRFRLKAHELFPYWPDLNKAVHERFKPCKSSVEIQDLEFIPELLGEGGFGWVYLAKSSAGEKYALKIFRGFDYYYGPADDASKYHSLIRKIFSNLSKYSSILSDKPFSPILAANASDYKFAPIYLKPFFEGVGVNAIMPNPENQLDRKTEHTLLKTYAFALEKIHSMSCVLIDNGWHQMMINEKEASLVDFDNVIDEKQSNEYACITPRHYFSKEQTLLEGQTMTGDLEAFSLMIHKLFLNEHFIGDKHEESVQRSAKRNKRDYPKDFAAKLPNNIRQVAIPLLQYPRDSSITARDFSQAIAQDYANI